MTDASAAADRWVDLGRESDFDLGGVTVRPMPCEVVAGGVTIRLQPRVMQVLVALARSGGEVVSRDALVASCWSGLAVGEDAINRCIGRLRRLAQHDVPGSFTIETLPRIGYRLSARAAERAAPGAVGPSAEVAAAREALSTREWETAYLLLESCDRTSSLAPEDLERLSWAAFWTARFSETLAGFERAEASYRRAGDIRGAARTGLQLARFHFERGNFAVGAGLVGRAAELLADAPECAEQGLMACLLAQGEAGRGELAAARATAERAINIGRRVGDDNAAAMGMVWLGVVCLLEGRIAEGIALHDAAAATATSGDLDPYFSGYVYCAVIVGCRDRADWHRAVEWTERADRWSERESVGFFPGLCRVHRAEILRFRGELREAERDALQGCELLVVASPGHSSQAFRELAEVRLRLGDLTGTEAACRTVAERGFEPQPVLARLRFARGDAAGAFASLERALADPSHWHNANHVHLLPAMVSIALAIGRTDVAEDALAKFEVLAGRLGTPAPAAAAACARGEVELAARRYGPAIMALRLSVSRWIEEGAPYEAASARCLLATALMHAGDVEAAVLEVELALSSFEQQGADLNATRAREQLAALKPRRVANRP